MAKYTIQTWTDGVSALSAARMAVIEAGIRETSMGRSTTFPSSPVDGDIHVYPADTTNGVMWHFMYNSGSASAHKWEFIGGSPLYAEVVTSEGTASTTYAALATAGPSIAIPKVGDYMVEIGAGVSNTGVAVTAMSYDIGGTGAVDADSVQQNNVARAQVVRLRRKAGLTAVTLTAKYRVSATTGTWQDRWMAITPVRVTP